MHDWNPGTSSWLSSASQSPVDCYMSMSMPVRYGERRTARLTSGGPLASYKIEERGSNNLQFLRKQFCIQAKLSLGFPGEKSWGWVWWSPLRGDSGRITYFYFPEICGLSFCSSLKRQAWSLPKVEVLWSVLGCGGARRGFLTAGWWLREVWEKRL